jgi:hypothetical protein
MLPKSAILTPLFPIHPKSKIHSGVRVQHCFKDWADPQKVIQVLVPGLEERARMFIPLSTLNQLSPGDASCSLNIIRSRIDHLHILPQTAPLKSSALCKPCVWSQQSYSYNSEVWFLRLQT